VDLKKELHRLGIKTYRKKSDNQRFVKRKDVLAALEKVQAGDVKDKLINTYHKKDKLVGLTFEDLITQIYSNYPQDQITEDLIKSEFSSMLKAQEEDALFMLTKHMGKVLEEVKD